MNNIDKCLAIINKTLNLKSNVLYEDDAKKILKEFGIPVVREKRVLDSNEAVLASREIGFPVVLKGVGSKFLHKTEIGLVKLGLNNEKSVRNAAFFIKEKAGNDLEAMIVQPMIKGKREFVAGMFKDPLFGPVIMFGLGGIFTEALNDVVFKIPPLTDIDISNMMKDISSKSLLDNFRGEKKADKKNIKKVLLALSTIAMEIPLIKEIDINPLIITSNGDIKAVDSLIIIEKEQNKTVKKPYISRKILASLYTPDSIAFVGASRILGKWGHSLPINTISGGFKGDIYFINPRKEKIIGKNVYQSINDIKGKIDLVIVTIPAHKILDLIPQIKAKKIKGMLIITSGFKEIGDKGAKLEKKLVKEAYDAGIIILGPNTMGICNPHKNFFCTGAHAHPLPGSISLVSQSGNIGTQLLAFAEQQDIGIRAFGGTGNEAMVTIEDYIELFELDEKTKTLVLYIESIKDGLRFFKSAYRVSKKKPIVMLSGGRTKTGKKAASSHTGALASNSKVFNAACSQAGIIIVNQPLELLDLSVVFSSLPLPKGNKVAIMTLGGGWGVVTTDLCLEYGLEVPDLPKSIISKLDKILPLYWSRANPVDIVGEIDQKIPLVTVEELLKWDGCDAVIHLGISGKRILVNKMIESMTSIDSGYSRKDLTIIRNMVLKHENNYIEHIARLTEKYKKPVIGVNLLTDNKTKTLYKIDGGKYKSVFFSSPEKAVKALAGMFNYSKWLKNINNL